GPSGITAIRAILPPELIISAVGGVSDKNFGDYTKAGIFAFGVGVDGGEGKGEGSEGLFVKRTQAPGGDEGDGGAVCRILQRPGD
ncbi:hypothetical protein AB9F45_37235, partial [Rhizobium leguminosarum]